ncbi:ATP binding cassette sub family B [Echinococcus multilocularis]|uniref:ATP-binding cassette sub-family B member 6 n=2 Tax=Echinococcus multilocularis TaxID=6211 RepID=A0A068YBM0_ECHMU|nr:ATP binding cassette sub family B [Echinococcus multilocularis]
MSLLIMKRQRTCPRLYGMRHGFPLILFWTISFVLVNLPLTCIGSSSWWWKLETDLDKAELVVWIAEYICTILAFILGLLAPGSPNYAMLYHGLLDENAVTQDPLPAGRWGVFKRRASVLFPFIWPRSRYLLQLNIILCVCILVVARVVNLYVPIFYKNIVNSLTPNVTTNQSMDFVVQQMRSGDFSYLYMTMVGPNGLVFRWDLILYYIGIRAVQGVGSPSSGLLGALQAQLWITVDQNSARMLGVHLFKHLHGQSMSWHLARKTGAMLRIVDRGTSSVSNVLNYLFFSIMPTICDIIIGIFYFITAFNFWYGLIVFVTMMGYIVVTIYITDWHNKTRRIMNEMDNVRSVVAVDSLMNFETVKYYNAEAFEVERYDQAIVEYQRASWTNQTSLSFLNVTQSAIITAGLLAGTMLCARDVVIGALTVGDFVLFCTYILQLYMPLNFFGTYYRLLQTSFVDMENMFELLEDDTSIHDVPDATPLAITGGKIEFKDVNFAYVPSRPVLKNVSFTVMPGKKLALVGQTGSGKSTVMRLLFRFYEPTSGDILIDGQNILNVTQQSLHQAIGVVPQDTVLFNDTINYNIRYGRHTALPEEVQAAARAAEMHERIQEFPQGYSTVVGERGLKLSGGEKQRVAIARTLLKGPQIVLLDEATSALDTSTERLIQESLDKVCENRTTIIVAHRLSTIRHVDEILVMHQGEVVERGNHEELLAIPNGRYALLWMEQSSKPTHA